MTCNMFGGNFATYALQRLPLSCLLFQHTLMFSLRLCSRLLPTRKQEKVRTKRVMPFESKHLHQNEVASPTSAQNEFTHGTDLWRKMLLSLLLRRCISRRRCRCMWRLLHLLREQTKQRRISGLSGIISHHAKSTVHAQVQMTTTKGCLCLFVSSLSAS
jgi:hypothetical protein